jgi:hypothetical protein
LACTSSTELTDGWPTRLVTSEDREPRFVRSTVDYLDNSLRGDPATMAELCSTEMTPSRASRTTESNDHTPAHRGYTEARVKCTPFQPNPNH